MYGPAFYTNICKLLSTLNGGIKHQKPAVKMPLSKVGLELSRILTNLGIIDDFSIGQRLSRVTPHSRLWDPSRTHIASSREAVGYKAMYLTLHINWDKHKPLWCRTPLAAAPHLPTQHLSTAVTTTSGPTSSSSTPSSSSSSLVPDPGLFTPPQGINSPTPERIKLVSKPSVQRHMGVKQLLSARRNAPPGIFLLSTAQGLLTDIDCELRSLGGVVLAHLGLPMGHVVQLRGLLTRKYLTELQSVLPPGTSAAGLDPATRQLYNAARKVPCAPLAGWDARAAALQGLAQRVQRPFEGGEGDPARLVQELAQGRAAGRAAAEEGAAYGQEPDLEDEQQLLLAAEILLAKLELRQAAWEQHAAGGGDRDSSRSSGGGDGRGGSSSGEGRGRFAYGSAAGAAGGGSGRMDRWSAAGSSEDGAAGSSGGRGAIGRSRQGRRQQRGAAGGASSS